jgi:hypothetical protein
MRIIWIAWSILSNIALAMLALYVFANPFPLVQLNEHGHRIFAVPAAMHGTAVSLLERSGLKPYGTFTAGVRQTLFVDGFTVIASGAGLQKAAISVATNDPLGLSRRVQAFAASQGIPTSLWHPPEQALQGKLVVLKLPAEFGWDIAYRLPGMRMPPPEWE